MGAWRLPIEFLSVATYFQPIFSKSYIASGEVGRLPSATVSVFWPPTRLGHGGGDGRLFSTPNRTDCLGPSDQSEDVLRRGGASIFVGMASGLTWRWDVPWLRGIWAGLAGSSFTSFPRPQIILKPFAAGIQTSPFLGLRQPVSAQIVKVMLTVLESELGGLDAKRNCPGRSCTYISRDCACDRWKCCSIFQNAGADTILQRWYVLAFWNACLEICGEDVGAFCYIDGFHFNNPCCFQEQRWEVQSLYGRPCLWILGWMAILDFTEAFGIVSMKEAQIIPQRVGGRCWEAT